MRQEYDYYSRWGAAEVFTEFTEFNEATNAKHSWHESHAI